MAGLLTVAEMIASIGAAAKMSAAALTEASEEQDRYVESTQRAETSAGMNKAGDATTATGLGLALQAQAGRR